MKSKLPKYSDRQQSTISAKTENSDHQYNNDINFLHPIGNALGTAFSLLGPSNKKLLVTAR